MVVVFGIALAAVLLGAGLGWIRITAIRDLLAPLAAAVILGGLGVLGQSVFADWVSWALPLAVVSLVTLLVGAGTGLDLRLPAPLPMGALALAGVGMWTLSTPLAVALHPTAEILPLSDDAAVTISSPADDEEVTAGVVEVTVEVTGGSIGPGGLPASTLPTDPEEAGALTATLARVRDDGSTEPPREVGWEVAGCSVSAPCRTVEVPVTVEPGTWELTVDLNRGDGTALAPPVRTHGRFRALPVEGN